MGFERGARMACLAGLISGLAAACAHGDEDALLEPTEPGAPRADAGNMQPRPSGGDPSSSSSSSGSSSNPGGHDDAGAITHDAGTHDAGTLADAGTGDAGTLADADADAGTGDAGTLADAGTTSGVITGGPCVSGAAGRTAVRVHFTNAGGRAQADYDAWGLPDHARSHAEAYGYSIGFVPQYVDPFLAVGGLQLDSSDFLDIELSTKSVATLRSTLSVYGRSFATSTSGSFSWQTFTGTGATATNFVANSAPYQWYSADMGGALVPGDDHVLLRIKAGPSSGSLVVQGVEICVQE